MRLLHILNSTSTITFKRIIKLSAIICSVIVLMIGTLIAYEIIKTHGRTVIEFDIIQNKELIHLSVYGDPPQFAIWLENPTSHQTQLVFVTHRVGNQDWIGKSKVPNALPLWSKLFQNNNQDASETKDDAGIIAVTGATPKKDHWKKVVEVEPGSKWIYWIEVNLSGDYNDIYQEFNEVAMTVDEYANGQPALVYRGKITAILDSWNELELYGMSVLSENPLDDVIQPVSEGITTAKDIFKKISIRVKEPKLRLFNHYK